MADFPQVLRVCNDHVLDPKRYQLMSDAFEKRYGCKPSFFARAPGRVNLIGEHIDYCGYAVLPMAIEQDVVTAVVTDDSQQVQLANVDCAKYRDFKFSVTEVTINNEDPQWQNYFLCGFRGMMEHLDNKTTALGMKCMVDGTVPPSSGLSSSSALVCCSALATMHANGHSLSKRELSDLCADCECYIGTQGGGMDQAISFMAQKGTAKLIEFNPLKATDVSLPDGISFVISNSCVEMNKAATSHFNTRVVECRIAAQILSKKNGMQWEELKKLVDVQKALKLSLPEAVKMVKETFHEKPYTRKEICDILGMTQEEFVKKILSAKTINVESFKLFDRATHVFSEAHRVLEFKKICDGNDVDAPQKLGQLMNDSHRSCRDMYECSCPDLDDLVKICLEAGALGSRLTGAGWGGCAVSMVPTNQVEQFLQKVQQNFYDKSPSRAAKVATSLFASKPGNGAVIYLADSI